MNITASNICMNIQSLCAFRRAALIGVWSVVFWSWGVLGGLLGAPGSSLYPLSLNQPGVSPASL